MKTVLITVFTVVITLAVLAGGVVLFLYWNDTYNNVNSPKYGKSIFYSPKSYLSKAEEAEMVELKKQCPGANLLNDYHNDDNSYIYDLTQKSDACKRVVALQYKKEGKEGHTPPPPVGW